MFPWGESPLERRSGDIAPNLHGALLGINVTAEAKVRVGASSPMIRSIAGDFRDFGLALLGRAWIQFFRWSMPDSDSFPQTTGDQGVTVTEHLESMAAE